MLKKVLYLWMITLVIAVNIRIDDSNKPPTKGKSRSVHLRKATPFAIHSLFIPSSPHTTAAHSRIRFIVISNAVVDENPTLPEFNVPLSEVGTVQAQLYGEDIKKIIGEEKIKVYIAPSTRSLQTWEIILEQLIEDVDEVREELRLRDLDHGFQVGENTHEQMETQKLIQQKDGLLHYRYINGESLSDVYDRVTSFINSINNEWIENDFENHTILLIVYPHIIEVLDYYFMRKSMSEINIKLHENEIRVYHRNKGESCYHYHLHVPNGNQKQ